MTPRDAQEIVTGKVRLQSGTQSGEKETPEAERKERTQENWLALHIQNMTRRQTVIRTCLLQDRSHALAKPKNQAASSRVGVLNEANRQPELTPALGHKVPATHQGSFEVFACRSLGRLPCCVPHGTCLHQQTKLVWMTTRSQKIDGGTSEACEDVSIVLNASKTMSKNSSQFNGLQHGMTLICVLFAKFARKPNFISSSSIFLREDDFLELDRRSLSILSANDMTCACRFTLLLNAFSEMPSTCHLRASVRTRSKNVKT